MQLFGKTFINEPLPKNRYIESSGAPDFGVELNRKELDLIRPYNRKDEKIEEKKKIKTILEKKGKKSNK